MRVPTAREMAGLDLEAIEGFQVPGILLMEHAAQKLLLASQDLIGDLEGRGIDLLCGTGNNGGDGFALARLLAREGARPRVLLAGDPGRLRGDAATNAGALRGLGIELEVAEEPRALAGDLVVDALLGTGARGVPRGPAAAWIQAVAEVASPVLAVDIPSGVPADGGEPEGLHVQATATVTMGLPKPYALCPVARDLAGDLAVARIGFPAPLLTSDRFPRRLAVSGVVAGALPPRNPGDHKGVSGKLLVVGGSPGLGGAAFLAARGALRAGAGLVKVLVPAGCRGDLGASLPEAMVQELPTDPGRQASLLEELASWADAVTLGCGLGREPPARDALARLIGLFEGPMVVDADGLDLLEPGTAYPGPRVLTPHPGELARMLGEPVGTGLPSREAAARKMARDHRSWLLLKGRFSLLTDGERVIGNPTGSPALATGGTGDVLAGCLGAFLAARAGAAVPIEERIAAAVYLHGLAGDLSPDAGGLAGEIADRLVQARQRLETLGPGRVEGGAYPSVAPEDGLRLL